MQNQNKVVCLLNQNTHLNIYTMKATQLQTAETLGTLDFAKGFISASQSIEIMNMLEGRKIGETPKSEASSIEIMDAWKKGWNTAKRAMMKEKFGF